MNFSLKTKILASTISLSIFGLSVFAFLSFKTYQEDKLAFVYDGLSSNIEGKSKLFINIIDDYELLLNSYVSHALVEKKLSFPIENFLNGGQNKIVGIYLHIPQSPAHTHKVLFENHAIPGWTINKLDSQGVKLSILDKEQSIFILKKSLEQEGSYAALAFRQPELLNMLTSRNDQTTFAISQEKVLTRDNVNLGPEDLKLMNETLKKQPGSGGLYKAQLNGVSYFVSFSNPMENFHLVNLIPENKVMLVQEVFLKQGLLILCLMASISLLIGTLAAKWLTWHLVQLTMAAQEFEHENFDFKVEIKSGDELASLGNAFNHMGTKIKSLLEELRIYNQELELKVAERTQDLQSLSNIQKGMLNALGQGFVLVDKKFEVMSIYSKIASSMFEVNPEVSTPGEIMGLSESDSEPFKELYQMVCENILSLDDMTRLAPELRTNNQNQKIQMGYAPINNSETDEFEYLMIVGTDKTQEFENMEKFKKEWNFSQMIFKIASNRDSFNKILTESKKMLLDAFDCFDRPYGMKEVQRLVHTVKGSFSYFNISAVSEKCHALESYLEEYIRSEDCPHEVKIFASEKLAEMDYAISDFIDQFEPILQYKQSNKMKLISINELKQFREKLESRGKDIANHFEESFLNTPVSSFFQLYPSVIEDLCSKLNKKVTFRIEGGDITLPEGEWDQVFQPLIHFVRNSLDHGFETPVERVAAGKNEAGEIVFSFNKVENELKVVMKDDGRGVNWEKMAAKDPSITSLNDALKIILSGGLSTRDEVSDISGRGVGVSSIYASTLKAGGRTEIESVEGEGITMTLFIPLSNKAKLNLAA